jgi:TP901 family phage tail tape measure protein
MAATTIASLAVEITGNTSGLDRAMSSADRSVKGFGGKIQSGLDSIGMGGALALGAMGAAAVKFGTDSVKAAVSFDSSMANINSILQLSGTEIDALGTKILDFGANTRAGPQATADAFYEIVSGVADASTHMAILEAATATAEAGNADLTATTGALVSVMNSYGFSAEEASFASDVLTKTVGAGVGSMDEFSTALGMSAGLAAQSGISFDELGGSMAFLTTQGFSAAQAGTRLTAITTAFLKPNEKMKKALKAMGLESGSAGLEMYGLAGMTQLLSESMGGSTDAMSEALGTTEALTGALALNQPEFEEFINNFEATAEGATDAAREIQNASTQASFDRLNAQVDRLKIGLGGLVAPVLEGAVNFVVQGIEAGADIIAEVATLGTNLGIIASDALNESLGWDPSLLKMVDGDPGPIQKQMREFWAGLGNVPVDILLDPKFSFMADMADDFMTVIGTEIAGFKPVEMLLNTLPSFLPPAIPETIAALDQLITGIQAQGLSPTQQLIFDAVTHIQFVEAMNTVKADVYNENRPEPRNSSDFMLPAPTPPAEMQTWADQLYTNMQTAVDTAFMTPLEIAMSVDATLEPTVNRTTTDPLVDAAVKEYATTVLKDSTILTPADLLLVPTLANGPLVEEDMRNQITALNYNSPATSVITVMTSLGNGPEAAARVTSGLQAQDYDTTVSATLTVQATVNTIYDFLESSGGARAGMNFPNVGGGPDGDNNPATPMATGGKVPYDNFAALLHKGEIVVPADYAAGMGGGGGGININIFGDIVGTPRQEFIESIVTGLAERGIG